MAYDISATLRQIQSHISAGRFAHDVVIGEPMQPPKSDQDKVFCAISIQRSSVQQVAADGGTTEVYQILLRCYYEMLQGSTETMELTLVNAVSNIQQDLVEDSDLGGNIRNIDVAGQFGSGVGAEYGHIDQSGVLFRVADITLPLIVDGSATAVP